MVRQSTTPKKDLGSGTNKQTKDASKKHQERPTGERPDQPRRDGHPDREHNR